MSWELLLEQISRRGGASNLCGTQGICFGKQLKRARLQKTAIPEVAERTCARLAWMIHHMQRCPCETAAISRFGGYMSCDAVGGRLKLDAKPITAQSPDGDLELMQFGFNFHYDIEQSGAADQIASILSRWDEAMNRSSEIMTIFKKEISE